MSIFIGLTGWGDHESLYTDKADYRNKLTTYSSHFPVVEVDSAFYAIQSQANYEKWVKQTPETFLFVIKASQTMTGHDHASLNNQQAKDIFKAYKESIQPVVEAKKLQTILFQFPPWFDVSQENIRKLRKVKSWMEDFPVAIEFRNQTWFSNQYKERTIQFMKEEGWIHTICDEPQAGIGSVPIVLEPTSKENTLIRFHGRNVHGWNKNGRDDWREVRFLYNYNEQELSEWVDYIKELKKHTKHITILFNNNSGGDAANNAKLLIDMLGLKYEGLHPKQMDLFNLQGEDL